MRPERAARRLALWLAVAACASACASLPDSEKALVVTATAYNSLPSQTDGSPEIGAWGDRLVPGMRAIAVSPDLARFGLVRGARVRIEGLPGEYRVLDAMPRRWQRRIDIFMGKDLRAARAWGRREVRIRWKPPVEERRRAGLWCRLAPGC